MTKVQGQGVGLSSITIGVLGSGTEPHEALSREVGEILAMLGVNLLTGGGGGVMRAVSRAFTRAQRHAGICIGVIPCASESERGRPSPGYPNEFVELPIYTHLPYSGERGKDDLSRNHINVLTSTALIALPGGAGTASEVSLAIDYGKPVAAYAHDVALLDSLPDRVPRLRTLADLRAFVLSALDSAAER